MKTNLLFAIFLVMVTSLYSQSTETDKPPSNEYYLQKSLSQRQGGNTLLCVGTAALVIPSFIFIKSGPSIDDYTMAYVSMGLGTALIISSIPVFDASARNRMKGRPNNLYLQKSKDQRLTGYLLLGLGTATFIIPPAGLAKTDDPTTEEYGIALLPPFVGAAMILVSVPILIQAGVNKRKGMSISFKNETVPSIQNGNLLSKSVPALSLKIGL
jgi:peptidoglycan/LPS O-acetylase OafA/YrhL